MTSGMMWFDDRKKPLEEKVREAAAYYLKKYGIAPNECLVHPAMFDKAVKVDGVNVKPVRYVLPNHLWIGRDDGG